jgi:hypothetical protein
MNTDAPPLKLRAYAGRENGLMVIGSPEALSELGQQLQSAGARSDAEGTSWPVEVASLKTEGPYSDVPEFKLSFHTDPRSGMPASLGVRRRNLPLPVFLVLGALAVVGAFAMIRWAAEHAL